MNFFGAPTAKLPQVPPVPGKKRLRITREFRSNYITIHFDDGSSDHLSHPEAIKRLCFEGVTDPVKVLDHVWNAGKNVTTILIDKNKGPQPVPPEANMASPRGAGLIG